MFFQYLKGAIEAQANHSYEDFIIGFQYLKGAIEARIQLESGEAITAFNTSKVQLKPADVGSVPRQPLDFQYLKGAIEATRWVLRRTSGEYFQYLKGAIEARRPCRLILIPFACACFQYLKGAIEARIRCVWCS